MAKNSKKRDKKYVTNKAKQTKSSNINTWILVGVTLLGAGLVIYLS